MKPVIAHVREQFLPLSETFIYQLMMRAENTRAVAVYAERQNEATFPWDDIYPVSYPGRLSHIKVAVAFLRVSRVRPYANSMEGVYLKAFRELRPDLVHAHFGAEGAKVMRACEELAIPLVVSFYGYDFSVLATEKRWRVAFTHLFRYAAAITAPSHYAVERLCTLGCPIDKIEVIRGGIDLQKLPFEENKSVLGKSVRFIGVGRLVEKKGTRHVLEALALTRRKHPGISYAHIGGGPLERKLKALAARLGVDDICELRGAQPHHATLQALREADIFLMPSVTAANGDVESQGIVLQEAQAMGLPVIATRHNGLPEGMAIGESGFLVPERDAEALAERMSYLIVNRQLWPEMGRRGRAFVQDQFNAERECARQEAIYAAVLASRGRKQAAVMAHAES